ncbi:MAG: type II toxin-antitoxin system RelE/ParE family toxin [Gammaproteobacteria bacterium]|nr:type II toxin-antitoxin system RelE/ParE family toxin [Gammaproteobacteria bacterium]
MRTFKTKWFHKWGAKEGLRDGILAAELLGYRNRTLAKAIQAGELIEVRNDG